MRVLIYVLIVICVLGVALHLYVERDIREFEKSLPALPSLEKERQRLQQESVVENRESQTIEKSATEESGIDSPDHELSKEVSEDTQPLQPVRRPHEDSEKPNPEGIPRTDLLDDADPKDDKTKMRVFEVLPDLSDVSIEALKEINRKHLIEKHGNIPEIEIFLKHFPFEAIQRGKTEFSHSFTGKENLEYKRVVATLFPNAANIRNYQESLELSRE